MKEISLADDANQRAVAVDDRQMADTPETHHIIGMDEFLVSIESHDVPGHDLADAQCFDVHGEGGKAGVMPSTALLFLGRSRSPARTACALRAKLAAISRQQAKSRPFAG